MTWFVTERTRRSIAICASVMLLVGLSPRQPMATTGALLVNRSEPAATEWVRYSVNEEEFSVLLPELPAMTTSFYKSKPGTSWRMRTIGAYSNGVVYAIYCYENPKREYPLTHFIEEFTKGYAPGAVSFARDFQVGSVSGKQYALQNREVPGTVRFYFTKHRAYVVVAMGAVMTNPDVVRFFSSFEFEPSLRGIEVTDGPGFHADEGSLREPSLPLRPGVTPDGTTEAEALRPSEVSRKVIIVTKPVSSYTEVARKNRVVGTVVLKAVFRLSGKATNIRAVSGLPDGLTDQAIAAARQIRFIPAMKDGRFVSMYVQLEYNFAMY